MTILLIKEGDLSRLNLIIYTPACKCSFISTIAPSSRIERVKTILPLKSVIVTTPVFVEGSCRKKVEFAGLGKSQGTVVFESLIFLLRTSRAVIDFGVASFCKISLHMFRPAFSESGNKHIAAVTASPPVFGHSSQIVFSSEI
jgi:hypothetical protein